MLREVRVPVFSGKTGRRKKVKRNFLVISLAFFLLAPALGGAQEKYPTKAIEMVVPFPAGGATDVMARLMAKFSPKYFDKPLVVVNKPGGGGVTGTEGVVRSKPDGYTLYCGWGSGHDLVMPHFQKMPFDTFKDLAPICLLFGPFRGLDLPGRRALQDPERVRGMGKEAGSGDLLGFHQGGVRRHHHAGGGQGSGN